MTIEAMNIGVSMRTISVFSIFSELLRFLRRRKEITRGMKMTGHPAVEIKLMNHIRSPPLL